VHYFAYGSNLDADQMRDRCPSSSPLGPARLEGHRLGFTHFSKRWGGGSADVIPAPDAVVWGVLYGLNADDLARLDRFEGGYERITVEVAGHATVLEAVSYAVREKRDYVPPAAYLEKMLRWGEHWALPPSYLEELRRTALR
jgi:gamma-glutamylcyclotransferase (GGCT)/AIG2-like uncharacterized protein YtfP